MAKSNPSLSQLVSLEGKTAIITGAARGIGRGIAERYAEAGASLMLLDKDQSRLTKTTDELRASYPDTDIQLYVVDVSNSDAVDLFWKELSVEPDILVNNAGEFRGSNFNKTDDVFINHMMATNFSSVVHMCRYFINLRGHRGGTIINIGSIEAKMPFKPDMAIYSVSKSAVIALTRSLAREYAKDGYKINVILPGGIVTEGVRELALTAFTQLKFSLFADAIRFGYRLPLGHYGKPDDIAKVALMLATPMSDYMCGAEVVVDGGFLSS